MSESDMCDQAMEPAEAGGSLPEPCTTMVGSAPGLLSALHTARRLARTRIPLLIVGETGTGKELLARYVHRASGRSHLVDVDCGALPSELVESLLFGHRRGAFTGAVDDSEGIIAMADGGTLFLDELGSLPLRGQSKLLRTLETGEVRGVGKGRTRRVDFRLVATVQTDVREAVACGDFRQDLMQRVAGAVVHLPSLAERLEDIVVLARHFATEAGVSLSSDAEEVLPERAWPGNVRQLRWTVLRAAHLATGALVGRGAILRAIEIGPERLLRDSQNSGTELEAVCRAHGGDADLIAEALVISRSTLYRRLRDADLKLRTFRGRDLTTS